MDIDWCLTCDCHFQGTGPYCSEDCQDRAGPSTYNRISSFSLESQSDLYSDDEDYNEHVIYHRVDDAPQKSQWAGDGSAGILAWAAEIPYTPSTGISTPVSEFCQPSPPSSKTSSRNGSSTRACRPPKLLRPHRRPTPPTLCMTKPHPAPPFPSSPISMPRQGLPVLSISYSGEADSMGKTSLMSGATESTLPTPTSVHEVPVTSKGQSERPSIIGAIASHVRSLVSPSSPLIATPSSSHSNQRISESKTTPHKFTVVAHTHRPSALNISFSSQTSSFDASPAWHLSSTILTSCKGAKLISSPQGNHLPPRSRGRKLSRVVV